MKIHATLDHSDVVKALNAHLFPDEDQEIDYEFYSSGSNIPIVLASVNVILKQPQRSSLNKLLTLIKDFI
jgi:hypothetical protein